MKHVRSHLYFALLLVSACAVSAQDGNNDGYSKIPEARGANLAALTNAYRANLEKYKGNDDVFVRPGVLAFRTNGEVVVTAEATGVSGSVEFYLISTNSDHAYESIAVALASQTDIWQGLKFVGAKPGEGADPVALRFWPKGQKVAVMFRMPGGADKGNLVPAETLIRDERNDEPLPQSGFVFIGATVEGAGGPAGDKRLVAEAYQPCSVMSAFSCSGSLLDVARNAPQGEVYEYQITNPEYTMEEGARFEVVFKVGDGAGLAIPKDLSLRAFFAPGTEGPLKFDLLEREGGKVIVTNVTLEKVFASYERMIGNKEEPHVQVTVGGEVELTTVRHLAILLGVTDTDGAVRVDSPPAGEFYYKAFLPDEQNSDRNKRILQPWELHLETVDGKITGRLEKTTEKWHKDKPKPELIVGKFEVKSTGEIEKVLEKEGAGISAFLIFAPGSMLYGDLKTFVAPVLKRYPTVYVFVEQ